MVKSEVDGIKKQLEERGFVLYSYPRETAPYILIMFEPVVKQFEIIIFTDQPGEYTEHHIWLHSAESKATRAGRSPGAYRAATDEDGYWRFIPERLCV